MRWTGIAVVAALFAIATSAIALEGKVVGVPVSFGDNVEQVQRALNTTIEPREMDRASGTGPRVTEIRLKTRGIWVFFNSKDKVQTIRLDRPFAGGVSGLKPGDQFTRVEKVLGPAVKRGVTGSPNALTYYLDDEVTARFVPGDDDEIETIFLIR